MMSSTSSSEVDIRIEGIGKLVDGLLEDIKETPDPTTGESFDAGRAFERNSPRFVKDEEARELLEFVDRRFIDHDYEHLHALLRRLRQDTQHV
jgi:hypothetical protein